MLQPSAFRSHPGALSGRVLGKSPRIWALLGAHSGDNNQVLALAEALGLPFEAKQLSYRSWMYANAGFRRIMSSLPIGTGGLDAPSRALLAGEPPDLVIAIGSRNVPVIRELQRRARGRLRTVLLGNPRAPTHRFDLIVTTPQYPVPDAPNVLRVPIAFARQLDEPSDHAGRRLLQLQARPHRLLLLGGRTTHWRLTPEDVADATSRLLQACEADGGSLTVLASERTEQAVLAAANAVLAGARMSALRTTTASPPGYAALLAAADQIFVTADSVSMISDALLTGKPVGLVPLRPTRSGRWRMAWSDWWRPGVPVRPRDLRHVWRALDRRGLAGTIAAPRHAPTIDYAATVSLIVRRRISAMLPGAMIHRPTPTADASRPPTAATPSGIGRMLDRSLSHS